MTHIESMIRKLRDTSQPSDELFQQERDKDPGAIGHLCDEATQDAWNGQWENLLTIAMTLDDCAVHDPLQLNRQHR